MKLHWIAEPRKKNNSLSGKHISSSKFLHVLLFGWWRIFFGKLINFDFLSWFVLSSLHIGDVCYRTFCHQILFFGWISTSSGETQAFCRQQITQMVCIVSAKPSFFVSLFVLSLGRAATAWMNWMRLGFRVSRFILWALFRNFVVVSEWELPFVTRWTLTL